MPRQCATLAYQLSSARARHALSLELRALCHGVAPAPKLLHAALRDEFCPWHWVEHWARKLPDQRALIDEAGELTWRELCEQAHALGAALANCGLLGGSLVVIVAENSRFLVTALLAVQRAGCCPVLLDPCCDAECVASAVEQSRAAALWVADAARLRLLPESIGAAQVLVGDTVQHLVGDERVRDASCRKSAAQNQKKRLPSGRDCFALLLTSGSTGKPSLVPISNYRAVLSGYGMGHICLGHCANDTIYCALPLSHATALVTGLCVSLVTGCTLALRARFSAAHFWPDIAGLRATSALYVGEIARRLLAAPESEAEHAHRLRVLYGTAMPLDVWHRMKSRFGVPRVVEFYGATELPLAMVNLSDTPGYMGRIVFRELSPWQVARIETGGALRNKDGKLELCGDDEPGELVFMGQIRTGDIVVRDAQGYVRYLDRQPGLFRQNGLNTSSEALRAALRGIAGVRELGVTHVNLARYDGQAGLVVVVPELDFDLRHLDLAYQRLPRQQRPRFLRLTNALQLNRGLKFDALAYSRAGIDPERVSDPLYAYGPSGFALIDSRVWSELQLGTFRF